MVGKGGAEAVDQLGDFFFAASGGVPGEQGAEQTGRASLGFLFIGDAGRQEHAEARLGDGVVMLQHDADAVVQGERLESVRRGHGGRCRRGGLDLRGAHGAEGDIIRTEPLAGFAGQVFGAEARKVFHAALRPGDVVTNRRRMGDPAGEAMDVLLTVDHPHDGLATHLGELVGGDAALQKPVNGLGDGALHDGRIRAGFTAPAAPGQTEVTDAETGGIDGMYELTLLAQFAPQQ